MNKFLEFEAIVYDRKYDMICLCETFVRPDISSAQLALGGYDLVVRKDGTDTDEGKCRGLLIYCKIGLKASEFNGKEFYTFIEAAGVSIPLGNTELKIVLVYRPPRAPFNEEDGNNTASLCKLLDELTGEVVVIGDFNLPEVDWERVYTPHPGERVVLDVIQGKFWQQHVDFPTHIAGNTLDLVLSREGLVAGVSDGGRLGKGDHNMLEIEVMGLSIDEDNKELVPDWSKADMESMNAAITAIDWDRELDGKTGLERWDIVKRVIQEQTDLCVPKKMRRVGTKPLWMSKNILRLIRKKRRLWKAYSQPGGPLPGGGGEVGISTATEPTRKFRKRYKQV